MRPNFLILGAAKCGTTSLHYYVDQHPQVYMSEPKEPRFFEMEYSKGVDFYWNTYFGDWSGEPAVGEASPRNLYLPYVPERIRKELPEARLVAILRNPVERALSGWWMAYSLGLEKLSFEDAIRSNMQLLESGFSFGGEEGESLWRDAIIWGETPRPVRYRSYLDIGYYAVQLRRYLRLFPRSQMKILFFEDLCKDPQSLTASIWDFVGVEADYRLPDTSPRMVATPRAGLPLLRIARATQTRRLIPKFLRRLAARLFAELGRKPKIDPALREWLVAHYYEHNRELEQIVERDLSHWDR